MFVVCLDTFLSLSFCLPVCLFTCLPICIILLACQSCLSIFLLVYLSDYQSLSSFLSIYLSVYCLSLYLSMYQSYLVVHVQPNPRYKPDPNSQGPHYETDHIQSVTTKLSVYQYRIYQKSKSFDKISPRVSLI